ncbi:MAG: membrane protein insertion efficiency factor YidD [Christensenellaceae bacterium]|jgi:hypothetical protein|nr:membrane protein insertion efficiency factor YidD [Christensenellaceae bacterium]MBS6564263.1 membrane protein insertion efficiency factor YidD [Clostridiales bacterium]PWM00875.1 MAG: membrane protein insertion efficiency factor YidD [Selenomonadales bacterium]
MKRLFLAAIRFYQKNISPARPPCCRYLPTCSEYAYTAIERFGIFKGCALAAWRIMRCNPFSKGGYDPVPEKKPRNKSSKEEDLFPKE